VSPDQLIQRWPVTRVRVDTDATCVARTHIVDRDTKSRELAIRSCKPQVHISAVESGTRLRSRSVEGRLCTADRPSAYRPHSFWRRSSFVGVLRA
jgi:hypothetical protein